MKKGFTLVELLAVIAILAILVIIALPNIMGMFNDAKKNSFATEIKEIYKIAEQTWMSESMFDTGIKSYARSDSSCPNTLDLSGRGELKYYIKIDKSGKVVNYYVTDGTYQYQYSGDGLEIEDIKDVSSISDLNEDEVFSITCDGTVAGNTSPYTGYIYRTKDISGHFTSGIGSSIEQMIRWHGETAWCGRGVFEGNSYNTCDSEDLHYDTEYDCLHNTWCYSKPSDNGKCSSDIDYAFGNQSACETSLSSDISHGYVTSGQYSCVFSSGYDSCYRGTYYTGEYYTNRSQFTHSAYVKHKVVDNIITESYVCFNSNTEVCFKNGMANYEYNKNLLASQEAWINSQPNGRCTFGSTTSTCTWNDTGYISISSVNEQVISLNNDDGNFQFCVDENGAFACGG